MAEENHRYSEIIELLQERGHTAKEIQKILIRVQRYDTQMHLDSLMESIDNGRFDLTKIVEEALSEEEGTP